MAKVYDTFRGELTPGWYKHYKGGLYYLIGMANHSETLELLVLYKSVETDKVWARPYTMWSEEVLWPDGILRPRFIMR